jgi:ABC-type phosphate/phosphonate transport system substrate-binding protein
MTSDYQNQQSKLFKRLACVAAGLSLALLGSCTGTTKTEIFQSSLHGESIRITEEPWRPQHESNKSFEEITHELFSRTRRRFEYVPALSYSHANHLVTAGEVDLFLSSSYAANLATKSNPDLDIIAVETPFASSALITSKTGTNSNSLNDSMTSLERIRGLRVGFGSRYAGIGFRYPLQQMAKLGITLDDLYSCSLIADHELLIKNVTSGRLDYAFIRSTIEKQRRVSTKDYNVVWFSPPQQDVVIVAANRLQSPQNYRLRTQLIALFRNLSISRKNDRKILDAIQVKAFEAPSRPFRSDLTMGYLKAGIISPDGIIRKCD